MTDPFYRSEAWREVRRRVLKAAGYRCAVPGCPARATHVDHVQSRRVAPARALDPSNLQPLCHRHHSAKTARRDGGFGNTRTEPAGAERVRGNAPDGTPLDPGHRWNRPPRP